MILGAVVIVAATLAAYMPAFQAGTIWDDDMYLFGNPEIKAHDGLFHIWFATEGMNYYPLTLTTFWLEWRVWGEDPAGYHAVSIVLHALASVLIWFALKRLDVPGAWLAALIFAVHPVNASSVAWIAERKNLLLQVFYLLSILAFLRFDRAKRWRWYGLSLAAACLALLSKSAGVVLPGVLLLCLWWRHGRLSWRDLLKVAPFVAVGLGIGLVAMWFESHRAILGTDVRPDDLLSRIAGAGWAVWFYLGKALMPVQLCMVHPRWTIDGHSLLAFVPLALLIAVLTVLILFRRSWGKAPAFAMGYVCITLLPVLGFLNIAFFRYSLVADHWQYLSIIAIIALVTAGCCRLAAISGQGVSRAGMVIAGVVVVVLGISTWRHAEVFRTEEALWRDTLEKNPDCWVAHSSLGLALVNKGDSVGGIQHLREAIRLNPSCETALNNLGNALANRGGLDEAITCFERVLRLKPNAESHNNLGIALARRKMIPQAIAEFTEALRIESDFAEAHRNLGSLLLQKQDLDGAVFHLREALRLRPDLAEAANDLGTALARQEKMAEAERCFTEAVRLDPNNRLYAENLRRARQLAASRPS